MVSRRIPLFAFVLLLLLSPALEAARVAGSTPGAEGPAPVELPTQALGGLIEPVTVTFDAWGVPSVEAANDHDALYALGVLHARDRLFQMDTLRRLFSGTLAELLGEAAVAGDIELRTLGLRRAARDAAAVIDPASREWLVAYTEGVNAYLSSPGFVLPPEYPALEITKVAPWTVIDSLTIAKGLAFGLSFSLIDLELTDALLAYQDAGQAQGFDGTLLFSEDLFRSAPFDPAITVPPGEGAPAPASGPAAAAPRSVGERPGYLGDTTRELIRRYREKAKVVPLLSKALRSSWSEQGSNWWAVAPALSAEGSGLLASDPHLDLTQAPVFYEVRLTTDPTDGSAPLDVVGVSFPGTPGVVLGCNPAGCWAATVHPMDVTDVYQEELVIALIPFGIFTRFDGELERVEITFQDYRYNVLGDGVADNLADSPVGLLAGGASIVVPRHNDAPIISVGELTGIIEFEAFSVAYTGWKGTREVDAIREFARAGSLEEFRDALQSFDFGSQNWAWVDTAGNIAYWASGELPIREDLQRGFADGGVPPYIVRDGTGGLLHEWFPLTNPQPDQSLEFEILPFDEMPQVENPAQGYLVSANNDPVGNTLDNDVLNETRPGGGIFYLNPGYATGFRAGRIQREFDARLDGGGTISTLDMAEIQGNNQLLDAEVFVPYIGQALANAQAGDAPPVLADLAADPRVVEAVGRLEAWDFSTPTGIQAGWDPGDDPDALPEPTQEEIDASVAATVYAVWRGQVVQAVVDGTLGRLGLAEFTPFSDQSLTALRNLLDQFDTAQGIGASGVDFFVVSGADDPADERDVVLLRALANGLDLLAGDEFAPAFANSTNQEEYRWGYLHRVIFEHPMGSPFSIPPAGDLTDLSPELAGLARAGGLGAVDASAHDARADSLDDFMFSSGPARRFVGVVDPAGKFLQEVLPGGESGELGDPFLADQLRLWLSNTYKTLPGAEGARPVARQRWVPAG